MDVGALARTAAPKLGLMAGAAVVGGAASYAAIRAAGNSDGGTGPALLGMVAKPVITGGLGGLLTAGIVGKLPFGPNMGALGPLLALPAGIGGAMVGAKLAHDSLERAHPDEYASQQALIDSTMGATQAMFREAGASEAVLARIPERYDRSYFNASYHPPLGPFGDHIRIGRSPEGGAPFGDDVIAHEFTHKVVHEYAPGLMRPTSGGEGRALHESLADTFAMVVDDEDWLVGEDAYAGGLRSFSHPEERGAVRDGRPQPAPVTREQLAASTEEHLAAGVGNKAAWRIGEALGREAMAELYVAALERRELDSSSGYADLARLVREAAVERHGADSREARVVDDAWRQAGY